MRNTDQASIQQLRECQLEQAAAALARGFVNDPLAVYMIPDPGERAIALPLHFATVLRMGFLFGVVYTTLDPPLGAAVWFAPNEWELSIEQLEQAGALALPEKLPEGAFDRFQTSLEHLESRHRRDVTYPHWYLACMGVDLEAQGRGLGSALIKPGLQEADRQKIPCYLETAEETNLPFYEKHGFEVSVDEIEPASRLRCWAMLRSPR